jgi:hypothetical protein
VKRCRAGDRTVGQVARNFDLTGTAVRAWVAEVETDAGERPRLTSAERDCQVSDSPAGGLTQGNSELLPAQLEPDGAAMLVTAVAPSVGDQLD